MQSAKCSHTKCCGVKCGPPVGHAPVVSDHRLIDAVSDHHEIILVVGNGHILLVNTGDHIYQEIPTCAVSVVRSCSDRIVDGYKVPGPILACHHDVVDQDRIIPTRLKECPPRY